MILIFATYSYFTLNSVPVIWMKNRIRRQNMTDFALGATDLLEKENNCFS